jgi:hypothetical protein
MYADGGEDVETCTRRLDMRSINQTMVDRVPNKRYDAERQPKPASGSMNIFSID